MLAEPDAPTGAVIVPLLFTVSMAVLDETQGLTVFGVGEPLNVTEAPEQTAKVPVIDGLGLIVTVACA